MKKYFKDGHQFINNEKWLFDCLLLALIAHGQGFSYSSVGPFVSDSDADCDLSRKGLICQIDTKRDGVSIRGWVPTWIECQAEGWRDTLGVTVESDDWKIDAKEEYWTGNLFWQIAGDETAACEWIKETMNEAALIYRGYTEEDIYDHEMYRIFINLGQFLKHRRTYEMMEAASDWTVVSSPLKEGPLNLTCELKDMIENAEFHDNGGGHSFYTYDTPPADTYVTCNETFLIYGSGNYLIVIRNIVNIDFQSYRQQIIGYFKNSCDAVSLRFANT